MKKITLLIVSAALFASATTAPLAAQEQPISLVGDVKVEKTVADEAGQPKTVLVDPDLVVPGDRLIFGTDYRNNGAEAVANFVMTNPVPAAVRLAPDADADLTVSVDGGASWGTLAELTVTAEDGSTRSAEHADVTHIRWTLAAVDPGASGRLQYPAIIR